MSFFNPDQDRPTEDERVLTTPEFQALMTEYAVTELPPRDGAHKPHHRKVL